MSKRPSKIEKSNRHVPGCRIKQYYGRDGTVHIQVFTGKRRFADLQGEPGLAGWSFFDRFSDSLENGAIGILIAADVPLQQVFETCYKYVPGYPDLHEEHLKRNRALLQRTIRSYERFKGTLRKAIDAFYGFSFPNDEQFIQKLDKDLSLLRSMSEFAARNKLARQRPSQTTESSFISELSTLCKKYAGRPFDPECCELFNLIFNKSLDLSSYMRRRKKLANKTRRSKA